MASRRASAPCRSDIFARSCPEKRLQNACREFWSTLVMSGSGESCVLDGRKFLARSKCADYCGGRTTDRQHGPEQEVDAHRTIRSEEHTSELQSPCKLVCRLLLEKKKKVTSRINYSIKEVNFFGRTSFIMVS